MSDFNIFLHYTIIMRKRALKSIIKNLYIGLLIVFFISFFVIFQFWKIISLNINSIYNYKNSIILIFTIVIFLFTLFYKKTPLKWHPASMIYFSGDKFKKIVKYTLYKKLASTFVISFLTAFLLMKFELNPYTLNIQTVVWNIIIFSFVIRYIRYNNGIDINLYLLLFIHYLFLNLSLYLSKYFSIILLFTMTSVSIYYIIKILNITLNFNKLFIELSYINKADYLARGNNLDDAHEFSREISAQKHRNNIILKIIRFNNPLMQKNIITFSRINLFIPLYISSILAAVVILYKFELFEFVIFMKESKFAIKIVALHQALFINNIIEIITNQKNLLIYKSKEGLYLPYNKSEIVNSFLVLGLPIILFEVLIMGTVFKISVFIILSSFLLYSAVFYTYLNLEKKNKKDIFQIAIYFSIFIISSYFID